MIACALNPADRHRIEAAGFFHGYTSFVWILAADQVLGGILVSFLIKSAGSLVKGLATSLAILGVLFSPIRLFSFSDQALLRSVSACAASYIFPEQSSTGLQVWIGGGLVIAATLIFAIS